MIKLAFHFQPMEQSFYLNKMTDLLSMYIDMEIKASRYGFFLKFSVKYEGDPGSNNCLHIHIMQVNPPPLFKIYWFTQHIFSVFCGCRLISCYCAFWVFKINCVIQNPTNCEVRSVILFLIAQKLKLAESDVGVSYDSREQAPITWMSTCLISQKSRKFKLCQCGKPWR